MAVAYYRDLNVISLADCRAILEAVDLLPSQQPKPNKLADFPETPEVVVNALALAGFAIYQFLQGVGML
jgi:hypothetical protein